MSKKPCEDSKFKGGLGLALSGGGFRASFFHIGLLARLAECGMLKDIVAISTVSGGSIIGAQYYLHLKNLFESKPDSAITNDDYIQIVKRIEEEFLSSVQKNIRMRAFRNLVANLKMIKKSYSRSDRLGELFDEYFYNDVFADGAQNNGLLTKARERAIRWKLWPNKDRVRMKDLIIHPMGHAGGESFHPMLHNETREHKVPVLLINSTVLNTGHNWIFEARTMGEPPKNSSVFNQLDSNWRLCRPDDYDDICDDPNIELGKAVAASACVPGIFPPVPIAKLYDDKIVQLVDGGVYDNQGIQALMDRGCDEFIVSDASRPMDNEGKPSASSLSVILRTNVILMERVREEQLLQHMEVQSNDMMLIHLSKGLTPQSVDWRAPKNDGSGECVGKCLCPQEDQPEETSYGVPSRVQDKLSKVRTDLDSFHNVEAWALMLDGYRMTKEETLNGCETSATVNWKFLNAEKWVDNSNELYDLLLDTSSVTFLKPLEIVKKGRSIIPWAEMKDVIPYLAFGLGGILLVAAGLIYGAYTIGEMIRINEGITIGTGTIMTLFGLLGISILGGALERKGKKVWFTSPFRLLKNTIGLTFAAILGSTLIELYLQTLDKVYLRLGEK